MQSYIFKYGTPCDHVRLYFQNRKLAEKRENYEKEQKKQKKKQKKAAWEDLNDFNVVEMEYVV